MGFRFRRSVRLFPGARVNIGLRGASMSFGIKGASVNFSSRGARATFGIPGTGLAWTSGAGRADRRRATGARRPSLKQVAAAERRAMKMELVAAAQAAVAAEEERQRDIVDVWRDLPEIPEASFYAEACQPRPFSFVDPPEAPDETAAKAAFRQEVEQAARAQTPDPKSVRVVGAVAGVLLGGALFTLNAYAGLVAMVLAPVVCWLEMGARWRQRLNDKAETLLAGQWPARWAQLVEGHERDLGDYHARRRQAAANWDESERERVAWAQRILDGDADTLETALAETLSDLDFPFETQCAVAVTHPEAAYVLLDLPEIEDVIPETRSKVLKDGRIKEVKRTKGERFADYARLTAGLALLLARTAFCAGPTLQTVHVAAYTQRRQRSSGVLRDEFVYEVRFGRDEAAAVDPAEAPIAWLSRADSRMSTGPNGELKKITPPSWLDVIATEGTRASSDEDQ